MEAKLLAFTALLVCSSYVYGQSEELKLEIRPNHQEVVRFINDSYFVTCSAEVGAKVVWYSPTGTRIPEGVRGRVHAERTRTAARPGALALVFEHIARSDRGTWRCASNHTNHTSAFTMIVNDPISFADAPTRQIARESGEVELKCEARGDPTPSVVWYYEGVPIQLSGSKYQKHDKSLIITNLSIEDRGRYSCKAFQVSTSVSNVQERNITLNVQHKPIPTKKLPLHAKAEQAFGYVGGKVNLTCSAVAEPAANFSWYRNNKRVPAAEGDILEDTHMSVLTIHIDSKRSFGDYVCKATNAIGTMEWVISLTEGFRPDPPDEIILSMSTLDALQLQVIGPKGPIGPSTLAPQPDNLPIIGYRFQYMPAPPLSESIESHEAVDGWYNATDPDIILVAQLTEIDWAEATIIDADIDNGAAYTLKKLQSGTAYAIRVAARNPAGLSAYTSPRRISTMMFSASPVGSAAAQRLFSLHTLTLLITTIIYYV